MVKIFKTGSSLPQRLSVPFLGLLLLLPLLYFIQVTEKLIELEERQLHAEAREQLLLEATNFQNDLRPEKYIEFALNEMNQAFGLAKAGFEDRKLVFPPGYDPELIDQNFIASATRFLSEKFGLSPAIFIASDCDLKRNFYYARTGHFPEERILRRFADIAMLSIALTETSVVNLLPDTASLSKRKALFPKESSFVNPHLEFAHLFNQHVSYFSVPPLYPFTCEKFFSNRFGNQRGFNFAHKMVKPFADGKEGIYAAYYIVFYGAEIPPARLLDFALANRTTKSGRGLQKFPVKTPAFVENQGKMIYQSSLSSLFALACDDYSMKNPKKAQAYRRFISNSSIAAFIDLKDLLSPKRQFIGITRFAAKLLLIVFLAFSIRNWLGMGNLALWLNNRLRLAVSLIVFPPVIALFLTIKHIDSSAENKQEINALTIMQKQMRMFEMLENEHLQRLAFRYLQKKKLNVLMFSQPMAEEKILTMLQSPTEKAAQTISSLFLSNDGRAITIERESKVSQSHRRAEYSGLVRILSGLGQVNESAPVIKRLLKQQYLLGAFGDSFWDLFATAEVLASENQIVHDFFSITPTRKTVFQLLATPDDPRKPFGILCNEIYESNISQQFLDYLRNNRFADSFQALENGEIAYGVFVRSTRYLRKYHWPEGATERLRNIAAEASDSRSSGTSITREQNETTISMWKYKEDSNLVFVAQARILPQTGERLSLNLMGWLLAIYGLTATLLIARGLSTYFLRPVEILLKSVDLISRRQHFFRISIDSHDEFSDLATAFNRMNNGLLQREKMRRFVSDKLIDNISAQKPDQSRETMVCELAVLSSDIRGFTQLAEQYSPESVVEFLNDYLTSMEQAIVANGGSVDKIVGDAITATFNGSSSSDCAIKAGNAAIEMRRALKIFNYNRRKMHLFSIENGIGIAVGQAVTGVAGKLQRRREFVMIGEPFSLAEKLEALSKYGVHSKILVDSQVKKFLKQNFDFTPVICDENETEAWEINLEI